ncbi:MAG: AAA family ATPase [Terriglobales bacterium]
MQALFPEYCVVLLIGLPGAGKSAYCQAHGLPALSSDALRQCVLDDADDQQRPELIFGALRYLLRARLRAGRPQTYLDATNLSPHERAPVLAIAAEFQYPCGALFFDVPLEVCAQRNRRRALAGGREVPEATLARMAAKLRAPARTEGFQYLVRIGAGGEASEYFGSQ